jgi:hypothetical protein
MKQSSMMIGLTCAALMCVAAIPANAGTCDIKGVVKNWTDGQHKKKALINIRLALKDLNTRLVSEGGVGQDYGDAEFGGAEAKQSFVNRVKSRQAEFSVAILLLAGRDSSCYVCPIKPLFPAVSDAGKACSDLIQKVKARSGFENTGTFNCDKVGSFSRFDLQEPRLGPEFWSEIKRRQLNLGESVRDQPDTYEGNAVVADDIKRLAQQLEPYAKWHQDDPDRDQFVRDVRDTGCPGYEAYITGAEDW